MPPPARAISSYGAPATFCAYSSARQPANGRCVWQSTKPGTTAQPVGVDHEVGAGVVLEGRDHAVAQGQRAGLERQLGRAVVAQVGQAVLRRAEDLGGAADRDRRHASSIGIRTPSRRAASIACS